MRTAIVFDLETTSVDVKTAGVVQCALLDVALHSWYIEDAAWSVYANPGVPIPPGASAIHGIYDAHVAGLDPITAHRDRIAGRFADANLVVTFNGAAFDLPILRRVLDLELDTPHFDVYRVWQIMRQEALPSPLIVSGGGPCSDKFTGSLGAAYSWLTGTEPVNAHDAGADCLMTAHVARALAKHYGLDQCVEWSSGPLPGMADLAGKITSEGVLTFSKNKGKTLAHLAQTDRGFLRWMLSADFADDTKDLVRQAIAGWVASRN